MLLVLLALLATSDIDPRPGPWPPRCYAAQRTPAALSIDGRLDDDAWVAAPWTDTFVDIEAARSNKPRFATRAKMLWDDTYFYVAAEMSEPHLWATLRKRDSVIYHDNDFEVFLDPDGDSHLYTEIELNALNTVWDLLLIKPYRDGAPAIHAWDIPGLLTAVHLDGSLNDPSDTDRGWSVELAIPFAVISETTDASCPPAPGDRWRVNFSRVQWQLQVVDGSYEKLPEPENNWVWSPQREIAMHEPEHWGIVEFVSEPSRMVAPRLENQIEWHLRYASYVLSRQHETLGAWPLTFHYKAPAAAPELPDALEGPTYWSDGSRYTLRYHNDAEEFLLTEDGHFTSMPWKAP